MTTTHFAFVNSQILSDFNMWQNAIDGLKLECHLTIDSDFKLYEDEGICRCSIGAANEVAAFEIYYQSIDTVAVKLELIDTTQVNGDICIILRCADNNKNSTAIMIACCALASRFNATIVGDGNVIHSIDSLMNDIQRSTSENTMGTDSGSNVTKSHLAPLKPLIL